jgi:hypothetical protein
MGLPDVTGILPVFNAIPSKIRPSTRRASAMSAYETSATVQAQGQLHIAGVLFAPGSEVAITVREKTSADRADEAAKLEESRASMRDLFARVRARNTEPIGPLRREELYDRKFFVDTNVLVYAASNAVADQARRDLALELLDRPDLALSG